MPAPIGSDDSEMVELQSTGRRAFLGILVLSCAALVGRCISLQGWIRPVRIASGSMAERLWGPHFRIVCRDCGCQFRVGSAMPLRDAAAVCPNCGCRDNPVLLHMQRPGCRVLIDRLALLCRRPRAWDKIAYRDSTDQDYWAVKRIVAGPGDWVAIHDGDVSINGQIQAKSLDQFRDTCVLVHDDRYRCAQRLRLPDRWWSDLPGSGWEPSENGYHLMTSAVSDNRIDWLCYHQWPCWPHPTPPASRSDECPILDNYGYNQDLARGALHPVRDLLLACDVQLRDAERFVMRLAGQSGVFQLQLDPKAERCRLVKAGRTIAERQYRLPNESFTIEFAVCDQHVMAAINRQSLFRCADQRETEMRRPNSGDLVMPAIAAFGRDVQVDAVRLYRDIFYLGPGGQRSWHAEAPVPANCWFVLGDNAPISEDSRFGTIVAGKNIIGLVVAPGRAL